MSEVTQAPVVLEPTDIELLFLLRRRKGWSREEAASRLTKIAKAKPPINARNVRSWEEGKRNPKEHAAKAIRQLLDANGK